MSTAKPKQPRLEVIETATSEVVRVIPLLDASPRTVERALAGLMRNLHPDFHVVEREVES